MVQLSRLCNAVLVRWCISLSLKKLATADQFQINCNHNYYCYTLNSLSLFWLAESVRWIFEISACDVITADYTIIMSRTLKVRGKSCQLRALCVACGQWRSKKLPLMFFRSIFNKMIIRFSFCDIQNNQGLGKGHQPKPYPYRDLSLCNKRSCTKRTKFRPCEGVFAFGRRENGTRAKSWKEGGRGRERMEPLPANSWFWKKPTSFYSWAHLLVDNFVTELKSQQCYM